MRLATTTRTCRACRQPRPLGAFALMSDGTRRKVCDECKTHLPERAPKARRQETAADREAEAMTAAELDTARRRQSVRARSARAGVAPKICRNCAQTKPPSEFGRAPSGNLRRYCKECQPLVAARNAERQRAVNAAKIERRRALREAAEAEFVPVVVLEDWSLIPDPEPPAEVVEAVRPEVVEGFAGLHVEGAPHERLRELLTVARSAGLTFAEVWPAAVEVACAGRTGAWRRALDATRAVWSDAYGLAGQPIALRSALDED